jgi:hypothetical protein
MRRGRGSGLQKGRKLFGVNLVRRFNRVNEKRACQF